MQNKINIVAFQRPFPPSYGGVIDMYYRAKALHDLGLYVILHTFHYKDRSDESPELLEIADEVHYYNRDLGIKAHSGLLPYIVKSRQDPALLENLVKNDAPILFEGLHTTAYLNHESLKDRVKIVRAHNIEHNYYRALAFAPGKLSHRFFFLVEAAKLYMYERVLRHADIIASLNTCETEHFRKKFPEAKVVFSPAFFDGTAEPVSARGDYVLYHGNMKVAENVKSARWILREIASRMPDVRFIFAGFAPPEHLKKEMARMPNVELYASPDDDRMGQLISDAKVHLLVTFQSTGVKLKLMNVLRRHGTVLANNIMTAGTGLEDFCTVADTAPEMCAKLRVLLSGEQITPALPEIYRPKQNAINLLREIDCYKPFIESAAADMGSIHI